MTEFVQTFQASLKRDGETAAKAIYRERLRPALLAQSGCRSAELLTATTDDDGQTVDSMLVVRWGTQDQMESALADDGVATLLMEMLLHVDGTPLMNTFRVEDVGDATGDGTAEEVVGTERVDAVWQKVQNELDVDAMGDGFGEHPYVRWWFLNNGKVPDFLELARAADAATADRLAERYAAECSGGLDDLPGGAVEPRSKTAQHLYYLTRICREFPDVASRRILEIGGGLGNLARMVLQLGLCDGYDLVDIQNVAALQRRYLQSTLPADGLAATTVRSVEDDAQLEELLAQRYGLVVSTFALSETPPEMRERYLRFIADGADAAFLVGQERWRGESVVDRIVAALEGTFDVTCSRTPFESSNVGPGFDLVARRRS